VTASIAVEELYEALDQRTLEILERRRGSAVGRRRGRLVRRALLAADLLGLSAAFLVAQESGGGEWEQVSNGEGPTPEAIRNVAADALFAREEAVQ